jgi:hypothetical protein
MAKRRLRGRRRPGRPTRRPAFAGYLEFGEGRLEEAGFPASGPVEHGGELAGDAWVVYLSDPPAQPDPSNCPARAELDNRRADPPSANILARLAESAVGACPWPVPTRASVLRYGTR